MEQLKKGTTDEARIGFMPALDNVVSGYTYEQR